MTRTLVGYFYIFRCRIDGDLHHITVNNPKDGYHPPIDVREHFAQRGDGHEVITIREPVFEDGGPTFHRDDRVIIDLDLRPQLEATVLGTLVDNEGKEWVGFINDLGNAHLESPRRLLKIESSETNGVDLFDPFRNLHFRLNWDIARNPQSWLALVREFPMMWFPGISPREALDGLIAAVDVAT